MNTTLLPEDEQPLRIKQVASWLGVGEKTVRRRIDSGAIKSIKMGGLRVVKLSELKAYWKKLSGGENV